MKTHGIRQTRQRAAILNALSEAARPLSLEELLARSRVHCPGLGERTVFRNLREMMEEQVLVRIFLPGQPTRYELPTGEHRPHFICRDCHHVFVLPGETPELASEYQPPPELVIDGEDVVFFGHCRPGQCPSGHKPGPAQH